MDKCYGRDSNDCRGKISLEHWISADLQRAIADEYSTLIVGGMKWLATNGEVSVGSALASRILCERHNYALSPLDSISGKLFAALRDDQATLNAHTGTEPIASSITLVNGHALELWLLKTYWGALNSMSIEINGYTLTELPRNVNPRKLAEVLWRGAEWPQGWGLYARQHAVDGPRMMKSSEFMFESESNSLTRIGVRMGAVELWLSFGPPSPYPSSWYRPGGIVLGRHGIRGWMVTAFAWPEHGHLTMPYTRTD